MTTGEKIEEAKELCLSKGDSHKKLLDAIRILKNLLAGKINKQEDRLEAECLLKILSRWGAYISYGTIPAALGKGSSLYDGRIREYEQQISSEIKSCE